MGLLKKLGLARHLPADLTAHIHTIQDAGKRLRLDAGAQAALDALADTAARNLDALRRRVEPALHALKREQFIAIEHRLDEREYSDPAGRTDIAELAMLVAETELALRDGEAQRAALASARQAFALAYVQLLDSGADLAVDLANYLEHLLADGSSAPLQAFLKALDTLSRSDVPRHKSAAARVARQLGEDAEKRLKAVGASTAPRDAPRTPNDILVHLATQVGKALKVAPGDAALQRIARDGRRCFMSHEFDRDTVAALVVRAREALTGLGDKAGAALCARLEAQLPAAARPGQAVPTHRAQLQDNLYGRVFDSRLVHALVNTPPQELLDASAATASRFADLVEDSDDNRKAAGKLRKFNVIDDVRSWAPQVPAFDRIAAATTDTEALAAVKACLQQKPTGGLDIMAQTYLMVKMSLEQQIRGRAADYMVKAGANYLTVLDQVARERPMAGGRRIITEGAGITTQHQPPAIDDPALVPSERPVTANRFGSRRGGPTIDDIDPADVVLPEPVRIQHEKALTFASGMSGTTNLLLHMYEGLQLAGLAGVGAHEFLMNSILLLVYDGGHSLHEVLWVANQLDQQLGLNLKLGDPDRPNEFVADYDLFVSGFAGGMKTAMEGAMDQAWNDTQAYLEKNSYFAQ